MAEQDWVRPLTRIGGYALVAGLVGCDLGGHFLAAKARDPRMTA